MPFINDHIKQSKPNPQTFFSHVQNLNYIQFIYLFTCICHENSNVTLRKGKGLSGGEGGGAVKRVRSQAHNIFVWTSFYEISHFVQCIYANNF